MRNPGILNVRPVAAVEHSRAEAYHVGFNWRDTAAGHHLASFTVAQGVRIDILEDHRAAVDEVRRRASPSVRIQQRLGQILRSKGC